MTSIRYKILYVHIQTLRKRLKKYFKLLLCRISEIVEDFLFFLYLSIFSFFFLAMKIDSVEIQDLFTLLKKGSV